MRADTPYPVIDIIPEQKALSYKGATMRLGSYPSHLKETSRVHNLYKNSLVNERHRHRYEVNQQYISLLENKGLIFSGTSPDKSLMEFLELPSHPFFIATQAHPEFLSRPLRPHPLFAGFVKSSLDRQNSILSDEKQAVI